MTGVGLIQLGNAGVQAGIEQAQKAAVDISRVGTTSEPPKSDIASLSESSVDLLEAKLQTQASSRVLQTGNEMVGSIIDTFS